jgi:hypothetical protein
VPLQCLQLPVPLVPLIGGEPLFMLRSNGELPDIIPRKAGLIPPHCGQFVHSLYLCPGGGSCLSAAAGLEVSVVGKALPYLTVIVSLT